MKKALLLLGALGALTAGSFGQNLVAHWDLDGNDYWLPKGVKKYKAGAFFKADEVFDECVKVKMTSTTGWSIRDGGSEYTDDYHCFGRFDSKFNRDQFVSWKVTFTGDAMGELTSFNFDIKKYDGYLDAFKLAWYDGDGNKIGYQTGSFDKDWQDYTVDLTGEGLTSGFGSKDTYEFRLFAFDETKPKSDKSGVIGLDNIRIHGTGVKCIPEPGTAMLGLLALLPFALRRRR